MLLPSTHAGHQGGEAGSLKVFFFFFAKANLLIKKEKGKGERPSDAFDTRSAPRRRGRQLEGDAGAAQELGDIAGVAVAERTVPEVEHVRFREGPREKSKLRLGLDARTWIAQQQLGLRLLAVLDSRIEFVEGRFGAKSSVGRNR